MGAGAAYRNSGPVFGFSSGRSSRPNPKSHNHPLPREVGLGCRPLGHVLQAAFESQQRTHRCRYRAAARGLPNLLSHFSARSSRRLAMTPKAFPRGPKLFSRASSPCCLPSHRRVGGPSGLRVARPGRRPLMRFRSPSHFRRLWIYSTRQRGAASAGRLAAKALADLRPDGVPVAKPASRRRSQSQSPRDR